MIEYDIRDLNFVITAIRNSIYRTDPDTFARHHGNQADIVNALEALDETRMIIRRLPSIRGTKPSSRASLGIVSQLMRSLVDRFLHREEFGARILDLRFRIRSGEGGTEQGLLRGFEYKLSEKVSNQKYLRGVFVELDKAYVLQLPLQGSFGFEDLAKIIPTQKIAPARFEVVQNRIELLAEPPLVLGEDVENIAAAAEYIRKAGEDLIQSLALSNCDPRLLENVRNLHSQIVANENVIKIGLSNIACSLVCSHFQDELPNAINGSFNAYNSNISLYVSQFPEWQQFIEKAATVTLSNEAIREIDVASKSVVEFLEARPDLADPDVPKTIRLLRSFMANPQNGIQKAAFAVLRTIENLGSGILKFARELIAQTGEKTIEKVSTGASNILVGMLSLALLSVSGLGTAAVQASSPWINQAAEIVKKEIERLGADPPTAPPT